MMKNIKVKHLVAILFIVALLLSLFGCSSTTPYVTEHLETNRSATKIITEAKEIKDDVRKIPNEQKEIKSSIDNHSNNIIIESNKILASSIKEEKICKEEIEKKNKMILTSKLELAKEKESNKTILTSLLRYTTSLSLLISLGCFSLMFFIPNYKLLGSISFASLIVSVSSFFLLNYFTFIFVSLGLIILCVLGYILYRKYEDLKIIKEVIKTTELVKNEQNKELFENGEIDKLQSEQTKKLVKQIRGK